MFYTSRLVRVILARGHANLLCNVPNLTVDPRRESIYVHLFVCCSCERPHSVHTHVSTGLWGGGVHNNRARFYRREREDRGGASMSVYACLQVRLCVSVYANTSVDVMYVYRYANECELARACMYVLINVRACVLLSR